MLRRLSATLAAAALLCLVYVSPAMASYQVHIVTGKIGYVHPYDTAGPAAQGGVCMDPYQWPASTCPFANDQLFVARYAAHTDAYTVPQTISSTVYLYYFTGSGWALWLTHNEGQCVNRAGGGSGYCVFGSPSSDIIGREGFTCRTFTGPDSPGCYPAFANFARGHNLTIAIRVSWYSSANGALLGRADYYPRPLASDIGCPAHAPPGRCSGPSTSIPYNLYSPGNVGYISMP